jgi:hypothetical protein
MSEDVYTELYNLVSPFIKKKNTMMREAISPHDRLCATLRFLAAGGTFTDLHYRTAIGRQTLGKIIPETCQVIIDVLKGEYFKVCIILYVI